MHDCCPQACLHCEAAREAPIDRESGCACLQVPFQTCGSTPQEWHLARMAISLSPPTMRSMCIHLTSPAAPLMLAEKDRRTPLHTSCLDQGQQMGSLTLSKARTQGGLQRLQRVQPSPARKALSRRPAGVPLLLLPSGASNSTAPLRSRLKTLCHGPRAATSTSGHCAG